LSKLFNLTTDQILNYENIIPQEITIEDKSMIFRMVDKMLTTEKFKDFFNKNVATL